MTASTGVGYGWRRGKGRAIEEFYEPEPNSGCWLWIGTSNWQGYGRYRIPGTRTMTQAFRYIWEHEYGPVPAGLELDHLCRVPLCVNPAHMEPVTHRENMLRGNTIVALHAAKTCAPCGHPYEKKEGGSRRCVRCRNARRRELRQAKREEVA